MRRAAVIALLVGLVAVLAPGRAEAVDVAVAAQVLPGTRTITTATLTPLADVLRAANVSGTLAVTVTEAAVNGVTPWSVTARLCGPDGAGTAADCLTHPDKLVIATDTSKEIAGTNLTISGRSVTPVLGGGTSTAVAGSQDMSTTRTIFGNTGQDPALLYSGTYASTSTVTLTPPSTTTAGAYSGYLVVTLVS
jgi:hypothetical protein